MKMGTIIKGSFISSFILILAGAFMKILHFASSDTMINLGLIIGLIFIVAAIFEVVTSKRINNSEKTMWTIGFILLSGLVGLIYIISGRRRVIANS